MKNLGIVELFAGIAGLAQGFKETGYFKIQGLLDIDPIARESFLLNFPETNYIHGNIRSVSPKQFLNQLGGDIPFGILGCPPCQGLSAAGKRELTDSRNKLIYNFFSYVKFIRPKLFVLENVPQVLEIQNYRDLINDFAKSAGYRIWSGVLNCALYGLPQTRQRAVVIGYHTSTGLYPSAPKATHYGKRRIYSYNKMKMVSTEDVSTFETDLGWYACVSGVREQKSQSEFEELLCLPPLITVKEALNDLPKTRFDNFSATYKTGTINNFQRIMRSNSMKITAHKPWGHSSDMKRKIMNISEGSVRFKRTDKGRSKRYFSQAYGRLHRNGLARTITGNFHNPGCGRFIHYSEDRTLTVREAARLQGFEDKFAFSGHPVDQRRIIGNAFPKSLAKVIASHVAKDFF